MLRDGTHKVANIERNPREHSARGTDPPWRISGVMLQVAPGLFSEPGETLQLSGRVPGRVACQSPMAHGTPPGAALYIRVAPVRTVSWDYGTSAQDQVNFGPLVSSWGDVRSARKRTKVRPRVGGSYWARRRQSIPSAL